MIKKIICNAPLEHPVTFKNQMSNHQPHQPLDTGCSLIIVFFSLNTRKFASSPFRQHSAAIGCTKNYQPLGVTVHSYSVESLEWIVEKHIFSWTPCKYIVCTRNIVIYPYISPTADPHPLHRLPQPLLLPLPLLLLLLLPPPCSSLTPACSPRPSQACSSTPSPSSCPSSPAKKVSWPTFLSSRKDICYLPGEENVAHPGRPVWLLLIFRCSWRPSLFLFSGIAGNHPSARSTTAPTGCYTGSLLISALLSADKRTTSLSLPSNWCCQLIPSSLHCHVVVVNQERTRLQQLPVDLLLDLLGVGFKV